MILDEIKDLIKDLEGILIKDKRFNSCIDFKNQVKTIYNCENNLNKNSVIPQIPSVDITPLVISNLMALSKPQEITKPTESKVKPSDCITVEDCKEAIKDYKLAIEKLLEEVRKASEAGHAINTKGVIDKDRITNLIRLMERDPIAGAEELRRLI